LKVRRLAGVVELFSQVLLLLLLSLPVHRISRREPGVVHGEVKARKPEQECQEGEPEDQQVAAPGGLL
jgi:hypothetical protein